MLRCRAMYCQTKHSIFNFILLQIMLRGIMNLDTLAAQSKQSFIKLARLRSLL